jgi:RimJ/RimL family protein N-acetyltransferase
MSLYPLITARFSIEPLGIGDLSAFVTYRTDPEIARFQSWDTDYSESQALALIQSQAGTSLPEPGDWLQLAVHDSTTGQLLGDLALHQVEDEESVFEIGFTFARQFQGRGFAKEAASALIAHLFQQQNASRVIAATDSRNLPSIKLLLALGFAQNPARGWTEEFKGEFVSVDFFELENHGRRPDQSN